MKAFGAGNFLPCPHGLHVATDLFDSTQNAASALRQERPDRETRQIQSRIRYRARAGRSGKPSQVAVSRQHEPRTAHAAERDPWFLRNDHIARVRIKPTKTPRVRRTH